MSYFEIRDLSGKWEELCNAIEEQLKLDKTKTMASELDIIIQRYKDQEK